MWDITGKVAVVTGGARRLGASIALALARAGSHVVIHYRNSERDAEATAVAIRALGVGAVTVAADITRTAEVQRVLRAALDAFGHVDILVANVGVFRRTPLQTLTEADWDAMLDGNLRATALAAQIFGLHMQRHDGGAIVALADVAGVRPWVDYLPYSVAKAGVIALTQGLAKALAPGVRVNAVGPGPVLMPDDFDADAQHRERERTLLKRLGTAEHVADAVVGLIRNDYITGVFLPVDGGRLLA